MLFKIKNKYLPLLLIAATRQECQVILDRENQQLKENEFGLTIFQLTEQVLLLKTGIGFKINKKAFYQFLNKLRPALAINFGICGALQDEIKIYENYLIAKVCQVNAPEIDLRAQIYKRIINPNQIKFGSLLTVNQPVLNVIKRKELFQKTGCQLIDMEGYKVTLALVNHAIPLCIIKQVTDHAKEGAQNLIHMNRSIWQKKMQKGIHNLIQMLNIE